MSGAHGPVDSPTVSVGIPTYSRPATLGRAVESVLSQTYSDLELIISDNASPDGRTQEMCEGYAGADSRVHYIRQPLNRGPTANFNALLDACRGDYVLLLSDDDWLELDYIERCLVELRGRDASTLVCGLARYFDGDGRHAADGVAMDLDQASGERRVRAYFATVRDNGTFYGLMRRSALVVVTPLLNVLANDWLLVAALAYQGNVCTLRTTFVNRTLGGTSKDISTTATMLSRPPFEARIPHLVMAWHTFAQLSWRGRVYDDLSRWRRLDLGLRCAWLVISWRSLAWHIATPVAEALKRRSRGKYLARGYFGFIRRLGAGRQKYF